MNALRERDVAAPVAPSRATRHGSETSAPGGAPRAAQSWRDPAWLAISAVFLVALPYALGIIAAPHGRVFLGALNNLGDSGQYLAALREGAAGHLLYTDQYTSLRAAPVLIYPLYTTAGLLLSPFRLAPLAMYYVVQAVAGIVLLAALWRLCRILAHARAQLAYALALFGGGLYLPLLLLSGVVRWPFSVAALTAPELSLFSTLLLSPHGAAGLAGELYAVGSYLEFRRGRRCTRRLVELAVCGLVVGLSYPFGLPVLLAVLAADTLMLLLMHDHSTHGTMIVDDMATGNEPGGEGARRAPLQVNAPVLPGGDSTWRAPLHASSATRERTGWGNIRAPMLVALALLPALAVALYYAVLFARDPLWGGSNMLHLPPPDPAVILAAFGPLLVLAGRYIVARRREWPRDDATRLLTVWAVVNLLLLLLPLPQSERMLSGWSVPLALLTALSFAPRSRRARRWTMALALSNVMMALLYASVTAAGSNANYYATDAQIRAVRWLAAHTTYRDVVMASAGSGNLIVSAAPCRVVVGQNFETFRWAAAQRDVLRFFAPSTSSVERATILRQHGVTLVLDSPYERTLGRFNPAAVRGYRLVYRDGEVEIFAMRTA